ncbi:hypothetical protein AOLI_G00249440 [Acnodon oligacanthus]
MNSAFALCTCKWQCSGGGLPPSFTPGSGSSQDQGQTDPAAAEELCGSSDEDSSPTANSHHSRFLTPFELLSSVAIPDTTGRDKDVKALKKEVKKLRKRVKVMAIKPATEKSAHKHFSPGPQPVRFIFITGPK